MAWTIQVEGMDELVQGMDRLPEKAEQVAALALYEGAGVMADAVSQAVQGIATEPFKYAGRGKTRKPSPEEKAILANAKHGVAKFQKTGVSVDTSVGYQSAGYANLNGKTKPVPLIANAINSGTSFMKAQPFMRKARAKKGAAVAAIEAGIQSREDMLQPDNP